MANKLFPTTTILVPIEGEITSIDGSKRKFIVESEYTVTLDDHKNSAEPRYSGNLFHISRVRFIVTCNSSLDYRDVKFIDSSEFSAKRAFDIASDSISGMAQDHQDDQDAKSVIGIVLTKRLNKTHRKIAINQLLKKCGFSF
jgi:hypothetical protein